MDNDQYTIPYNGKTVFKTFMELLIFYKLHLNIFDKVLCSYLQYANSVSWLTYINIDIVFTMELIWVVLLIVHACR